MTRRTGAHFSSTVIRKGNSQLQFDQKKIRTAILQSIEPYDFPSDVSQDIAIHMTDWLPHLEEWVAFCKDPESMSVEAVDKLLLSFLIKVPNRVAAASKLLLRYPLEDIFNVGIFDEEE